MYSVAVLASRPARLVLLAVSGCEASNSESAPGIVPPSDSSLSFDTGEPTDTDDTAPPPDTGPPIQPPGPIEHVLLISNDTLRADMVTEETMPLLFARMSEGIVLEQHWNLGSWTRHTMPGLMTGKTVVNLGPELYLQQDPQVPDSAQTLAEILLGAGFDTYFDNANDVNGSEVNLLQGYDFTVERNTGAPGSFGGAGEQADRVAEWVGQMSGAWFAHLHTFDTHDPYLSLAPSCQADVEALAAACPYDLIHGEAESMNAADFTTIDYEACTVAIEAAHRCEATFLDPILDDLLRRLEASGDLDRTLVVVTTDHGEGWGEHSWNHHHDLYAPVTRGFAWFWYPGVGGLETVEAATSQADVVPTILSLAAVATSAPMDGFAVTALPEDRVVTHFACDPHVQMHGAVSADGARHLLWTTPGTWELHDPIGDPAELVPLAEDPDPALVNAIEAQQAATVGYCQ